MKESFDGFVLKITGACTCGKYLHVKRCLPAMARNSAGETMARYTCPSCSALYLVKEAQA